jgi:DnaJ family protein B protein 12
MNVVFSASFGGPGGFRTTRMGGQPRAQQQQQGQAQTGSSGMVQLLPLLLLLAFSLLNALPSLLSGPSHPDPPYTFTSTQSYNAERATYNLGIKYFVNEATLQSHPVIGAELKKAESDSGSRRPGKGIRHFEDAVEQKYTSKVRDCGKSSLAYADVVYTAVQHVPARGRAQGEAKGAGDRVHGYR